MGCTSSKPAPKYRTKQNPNQLTDPYRPPRKSTRPLHPSAHPPDALPFQPGTYVSRPAPVNWKNSHQTAINVPPPVAFATQRQREAARMRTKRPDNKIANDGKESAWRENRQQQPQRKTSRSNGRNNGWVIFDEDSATGAKKKETGKPDQRLKNNYPPCPGPAPCKPIPVIPRKPVPKRSAAAPASSSQAKGNVKRYKPSTVVWQAPNQSRFTPAPGPPPNRPIPLLPIAKPQQATKNVKAQQQAHRGQYAASAGSMFPARPGPRPGAPLSPRPLVSPLSWEDRNRAPLSVCLSVSSLGSGPERWLPQISRPGQRR